SGVSYICGALGPMKADSRPARFRKSRSWPQRTFTTCSYLGAVVYTHPGLKLSYHHDAATAATKLLPVSLPLGTLTTHGGISRWRRIFSWSGVSPTRNTSRAYATGSVAYRAVGLGVVSAGARLLAPRGRIISEVNQVCDRLFRDEFNDGP